METVEERVAFLEGKTEEQSHMVDGIRGVLVSLEARMDRRFQQIDLRFEGIDRRFGQIDRRFEGIDRRFEQIDRRFEGMDGRFDSLDAKMSRQFMWLVGLIVTACIGSVGALSTVMAALLAR